MFGLTFIELIAEKGTDLIKPFSSLAGFDMAIEDSKGLVLGGTGNWVEKVGTYRPEGSYFDLTLKTGEPYACTDPKFSPQCFKCPIRSKCPYSFTASYPIIFNGEVRGLIGYLGYKNDQREFFLERRSILLEALEELTSFFALVYGYFEGDKHRYFSSIYEDILNELNEGIMFLDSRLRVTYVNNAASSMLNSAPNDLLGKRLKSKLPDVENVFRYLREINNSKPKTDCRQRKAEIDKGTYRAVSLHQRGGQEARFVIIKDLVSGAYRGFNSLVDKIVIDQVEFEGIVGSSEIIDTTKTRAARMARADMPVLITGETGVGKELFAKAMHKISSRRDNSFVVLNCAAIPENLVESELFGYENGAFSGASRGGKLGKLEAANSGTIFLDEIGELPLSAQSKLLRAVEQMEIDKVGSTQPIKIDVRIIAATNCDLEALLEKGKFRGDLYYRLNIMPLEIPPLRERREDIPTLIAHFLKNHCREAGGLEEQFSNELMGALFSYDWPGNVRELKNICQFLTVHYTGGPLLVEALPPYMQRILFGGEKTAKGTTSDVAQKEKTNQAKTKGAFQAVNEALIRQALKKYGFSTDGKRRAADSLGISLTTLYRKMKKHNIRG